MAELERTVCIEREPFDRVHPREGMLEVEGCPRAASMSCQRTAEGCCDVFTSKPHIAI